jgi:hypothetical protein
MVIVRHTNFSIVDELVAELALCDIRFLYAARYFQLARNSNFSSGQRDAKI